MAKRLENQVAWITGAASGMGEGISRLFAEEGAAVAMVDVQADRGKKIADEIKSAGGRAAYIQADVTKDAEVRASIEQAVKQFGGVQILVNCAGIVHVGPLHELPESEWDRVMVVNVKSIYLSIKHGIPHLKKNSRSYVVN